jgi:hypothetical protein
MVFGPVPGSDGSGYDPNYPTVTPAYVAMRLNEEGIYGEITVVAVGKLGSPNRDISGIAVNTDSDSITEIANRGGDVQAQWSALFKSITPFIHIQSISIIEW